MIFIRLKPTNYSRIEKRLNPGECGIEVTGHCKTDWCPVRQGRFDGWMHRDQLAPMSPPVYCVARVDRGWTLDLHEQAVAFDQGRRQPPRRLLRDRGDAVPQAATGCASRRRATTAGSQRRNIR